MSLVTKKYYDKNAVRWSDSKTNSFYHEKQFKFFNSLLKSGQSVLDIGCANAVHVPLFLGIGRKLKYTGIDISNKMLEISKRRYPQLTFMAGDALKFKSAKKFDGFWSAATLMHIPRESWPALLTNIEKNMNSGAIGYLTLPTARPNPASKTDQRHFEFFRKGNFEKIAHGRKWKILKKGEMEASTPNATWYWYIIKLP